jgi:hypothetical protein
MDRVAMQERTQTRSAQYEHEAISSAPGIALQSYGTMLQFAGERLKQEQLQQEVTNYNNELMLRQNRATVRLMEAETHKRMAEIQADRVELEKKQGGRTSARGLMGQWLPTPDGKAMQLIPTQTARGYDVITSEKAEDIKAAQEGTWRRTVMGSQRVREEDPYAAARIFSGMGDAMTDEFLVGSEDAPEAVKEAARKRIEVREHYRKKSLGERADTGRNGKMRPRTVRQGRWPELRASYTGIPAADWRRLEQRFESEDELRDFLESEAGKRWRKTRSK